MKLSQTVISSVFVTAQLWATTQASPVVAASAPESAADKDFDAVLRNATLRKDMALDQTLQRRLGKSWWDKLSRDGPDPTWGWGRYRCFESGSWVKNADISNNLDNLCLGNAQSFLKTGFDYSNAPSGTEQQFSVAASGECEGGSCQQNGGNPTPNTIYAYYGPGNAPAVHANADSCKLALTRIFTLCHGDHQDTRGGFWWTDDFPADGKPDRTYFGFDPTADDGKGH
ncbi:MAG: hypothetical protein M1812_007336 [Candelaria pacifica]|nr:MAG: hypothetical protein M1812_007336 [Candelaria pacifica]